MMVAIAQCIRQLKQGVAHPGVTLAHAAKFAQTVEQGETGAHQRNVELAGQIRSVRIGHQQRCRRIAQQILHILQIADDDVFDRQIL